MNFVWVSVEPPALDDETEKRDVEFGFLGLHKNLVLQKPLQNQADVLCVLDWVAEEDQDVI